MFISTQTSITYVCINSIWHLKRTIAWNLCFKIPECNLEILLAPFLEFYRVRQEVDQHTKKTESFSQNLMSKEHEILDLKRSKIELERSLSSLNKQIDDQSSTNKRYKIGGLAIKHTWNTLCCSFVLDWQPNTTGLHFVARLY